VKNTEKNRRSRGRPRKAAEPRADSRVQSIDRALVVFKLLADETKATLNVICATTGLPFSTTHRILETLRLHDMVYFDEVDQTWGIGVEAFRIGQGYARRMSFVDVGRETMRQLTDKTGETSNIAVFENKELVHVSQIETTAPIRAFVPPGSRSHLHASGIGKVLLAYMNEKSARAFTASVDLPKYTANTVTEIDHMMAQRADVRGRGWAMDDEERYIGMRCIAAPIFNEFGEAIAGLSISGPAARLTDDRIDTLAEDVLSAADSITYKSGGRRQIVE
jgi:IclR family acetate operon transcriptional repressor